MKPENLNQSLHGSSVGKTQDDLRHRKTWKGKPECTTVLQQFPFPYLVNFENYTDRSMWPVLSMGSLHATYLVGKKIFKYFFHAKQSNVTLILNDMRCNTIYVI